MCKDVPQASTIPRSFVVGEHDVPHLSKSTLSSAGGSTLPQWQYWRSLIYKDTSGAFKTLWKASPKSCKHEASFSTCFDASSHTDVTSIEMEKVSRKEVRRERVIVASQDITSKIVRALVVFHTFPCAQHTIRSPYLSMLAEWKTLIFTRPTAKLRRSVLAFFGAKAPLFIFICLCQCTPGKSKFKCKKVKRGMENHTFLHSTCQMKST